MSGTTSFCLCCGMPIIDNERHWSCEKHDHERAPLSSCASSRGHLTFGESLLAVPKSINQGILMEVKSLQQRLKAIVATKAITQKELASLIGLSYQTYRRFMGLNKYHSSFSDLVIKKVRLYVDREEKMYEIE